MYVMQACPICAGLILSSGVYRRLPAVALEVGDHVEGLLEPVWRSKQKGLHAELLSASKGAFNIVVLRRNSLIIDAHFVRPAMAIRT